MNTEISFESASQMAGWLHYGGKVFNAKDQKIYVPGDFYMDTMWDTCFPIGELPEHWCPFQAEIDVALAKFERPNSLALDMFIFESLEQAKNILLKDIDPRLSKK